MSADGLVHVQHLLTGVSWPATIQSSDGRTLELEMGEDNELSSETPVEITTSRSIYLGIVELHRNKRLWVTVEHDIDRAAMKQIQLAWKENKPGF